jgi:polygalacturonase
LFEPVECHDVLIDGISTGYAGMWSIHLLFCDGFVARNVTIRSTRSNGDGFDVDSSRDVHIEHCDIDSGDDCVAVKSGRGMDAVLIARPIQDLYITDCKLGSGFAGVGVGTEITAGVLNLHVQHCTFTHGANAIYLKSRTERGGFIMNVSGDDIDCGATRNFLGIDLLDKGIADAVGVPGNQGLTLCSNVSFDNIRLKGTGYVINATYTSPEKPVDHLTLTHVTGTSEHGIAIANMRNVTLGDINLTGFTGPLLSTDNVTGTGLDGAVPIAQRPPKP